MTNDFISPLGLKMRFITIFFIVILPLFFVHSKKPQLWLVTDWDPAVEDELNRTTDVYFQKGRVKVVKFKKTGVNIPKEIENRLRPITMNQIKVYRPPRNKPAPKPKILDLIAGVSQEKFDAVVERLTNFSNREVGGLGQKSNSGNIKAVHWIKSQFEEMNYETSLFCYKQHDFDKECNVVAEKKGTSFPQQVVVVLAHLDDVGHEKAGADDNASGMAALLTMAKAWSEASSEKTVRFLATNGEEWNLNGSRAYVRELEQRGELSQLIFTINMDMIAYNSDGIFEIETNSAFERQANWYADLARQYTRLTPEITIPAWGSDHVPFLRKNIPSVLTIENWQTKTPCYHRSCDKPETLNTDYAMQIVKLNLAAISELTELH